MIQGALSTPGEFLLSCFCFWRIFKKKINAAKETEVAFYAQNVGLLSHFFPEAKKTGPPGQYFRLLRFFLELHKNVDFLQ